MSQIELSSVFFANVAIGLALAAIIFAISGVVGAFYANEELVSVLKYLSIVPPIASLGRVHAAKLTRGLDFKALTIRDLFASLLGGVCGVIAAYSGCGVYSLVWQSIVATVVGTVLLWVGTGWRPSLVFSWKRVQELLRFSGYVFLDRFTQQFLQRIDTLFIGKVFSPAVLGLYSRAESLKSLVNNYSTVSITKISFPLLSSIQEDKARFGAVLTKIISTVLVLSSLFVGTLFFMSEWLVTTLYGTKWVEAVPIFQILVFTCITHPFRSIMLRAALSLGYASLKFRLGVFNNIMMLLSLPIGFFFGIEAFAISYVGIRGLVTPLNWLWLRRRLGLNLTLSTMQFLLPLIVLLFWVSLFYSGWLGLNNAGFAILFLVSYFVVLRVSNSYGLSTLLIEAKKLLGYVVKKTALIRNH